MKIHERKLDVIIGPLSRVRVIRPEILDDAPRDEAQQSLDDLIRINRWLGGHSALLHSLRGLVRPHERFTMLDVGAGSGDMGAAVRAAFPNASVLSLDYRMHHVARAPSPRLVADAFLLPVRERSVDVVHCSLFLHHFTNPQVVQLLASFGKTAVRYVVLTDLERHMLPKYFIPATRWLFGWHPITIHDAPVSVDAAFRREELRHLAEAAGLRSVKVRRHLPAFRLALTALPGGRLAAE